MSKEEVDALIAPPEDTIELIDGWLASHDIYEEDFTRSSARDWITVKVPVSVAEKMLDTVSFRAKIRAAFCPTRSCLTDYGLLDARS